MEYVNIKVLILEKAEQRITPANWIFCSRARSSVEARATAVPREWPRITIRSGGIPAVCIMKFIAVMASVMRPFSEGSPDERPKPR